MILQKIKEKYQAKKRDKKFGKDIAFSDGYILGTLELLGGMCEATPAYQRKIVKKEKSGTEAYVFKKNNEELVAAFRNEKGEYGVQLSGLYGSCFANGLTIGQHSNKKVLQIQKRLFHFMEIEFNKQEQAKTVQKRVTSVKAHQ